MTADSATSMLPEYANNPFIARLPALKSQREMYQDLLNAPHFSDREIGLPTHIRKHCIARLSKCFFPQARQVDLAERFSILLRQGYVGRNPLTHDYLRHLHNGIERIEVGSLDAEVSHPVENTATSFALLGCSGVGKTLAMKRVLAQYPQTIEHDTPFSLTQIVWLRLEAPALGSLSQLCIDFFHEIDKLLGTDYVKRYATKVRVEQMLANMAHVAHLHALGVLVIDEIQHLRKAKVGAETLMNFLVKLVNTIGVPVIPIGTLSALPILQGSFSQARRSTGLGSLSWDRMAQDNVWGRFIKQLWKYQWTNPKTELTEELNAVFYDESQGVADLAVKLFMLVQLRLVSVSEARPEQSEAIMPALIRRVAKEEFSIVAPMIEALREKDAVKLSRYDDLHSLSDHISVVLSRAMQGKGDAVLEDDILVMNPSVGTPSSSPTADLVLTSLVRMGVAEDVARLLTEETMAKRPTSDVLTLMSDIVKTLTRSPPKIKSQKPKSVPMNAWPQDDLRRIVADGKVHKQSAYEALLAAGVARSPSDLAA